MSTRFYGLTIPTKDLWPAVHELRDFVEKESPLFKIIRTDFGQKDTHYLLESTKDVIKIDLQCFQPKETPDITWIRIIEHSYFVMNNTNNLSLFKPFMVDTRSDYEGFTQEDVDFVETVLDPLIEKREYFIINILNSDILAKYYWDYAWRKNNND